ncbi:MAG: Obg family GTPase CgtA [Actinomycetota bacterium]
MDPHEQETVLLHELGQYRPDLLERPRLVIGTKTDAATKESIEAWGSDAISAVTGSGVRSVLGRLAVLVREARGAEPPRQAAVTIRPIPEGTTIDKVGESEFRLSGRDVERAVALSDVTTPDALNYIDERLKTLGIPRLLARAGATDGCVVHIGTFSFDYTPES